MAYKSLKRKQIVEEAPACVIELGKNKRVSVRQFKGYNLVDIREFYDAGGVQKPGKKGISLSEDLWRVLMEKRGEIDDALEALSSPEKKKRGEDDAKEEDEDDEKANESEAAKESEKANESEKVNESKKEINDDNFVNDEEIEEVFNEEEIEEEISDEDDDD